LTFLEIFLKKVILAGGSMDWKISQTSLQVSVKRELNSFCFDLIRSLAETFNITIKPKLLRSLWNRI